MRALALYQECLQDREVGFNIDDIDGLGEKGNEVLIVLDHAETTRVREALDERVFKCFRDPDGEFVVCHVQRKAFLFDIVAGNSRMCQITQYKTFL
jgi:hypothetical protein